MIEIGEIGGKLTLEDAFSASADKLFAILPKLSDSIDRLAEKIEKLGPATSRPSKKQTDDLTKVQQAYQRVAASLDPVVARTYKYQAAEKALTAARERGIISQREYNRQLGLAKSKYVDAVEGSSRLQAAFTSAGRALAAQALGVIGFTVVLNKAVDLIKSAARAQIEAEQSAVRLASAHARSGTSIPLQQLEDLAAHYSELSGLDDELIQDAIALALRYNRIGADVFPRVVKAAIDLSRATGIDLSAAMDKVAKITNLPLRGLTLLHREGYAVGKSQSDMVKQMLRANDVAGAQGVLLGILESRYKNAAADARDTLGGALEALSTNWENFLERVGQDHTGPARQGIEALNRLLTTATEHVDHFSIGWNRLGVAINASVATGLRALAELVDSASLAARVLGPIGFALTRGGADVSRRLRGGADAADAEAMKQAKSYADALQRSLGLLKTARTSNKGAVLELTDAEGKLSRQRDQEAEKIKRIVDAVNESIAAHLRASQNAESLWVAALKGAEEYRKELLRQKIAEAILKEENKLREIGKKLTDDQRRAIAESITATEKHKERTDSLVASQARLADLANIEIKFDPKNVSLLSTMTIEITDKSVDEWMEFGERIREGLATSADQVEKYMRDLEYAVKEGYILPIEYERELSRLRIQLLNEQIDQITSLASGWQQFFSTIGSMFGGFAASVANVLQQMISTVQSFQSAGNAIGGQLGGWLSAAGPFFAVVGAIYGAQRASIAASRQRQYTSQTTISDLGDVEILGRQGRALANALDAALQPILNILGRTLEHLPEITIRAREDGREFQAVVNGMIVGWFATMEEAIDAAAIAAIQAMGTAGLSDTIRRVLERTGADTAEALLADLNFGQWYERLGLSDLAQRLFSLVDEARAAFQNADRLGLELSKIQDWLAERIGDLKSEALGIDTAGINALRTLRSFITALDQIGQQQRAPIESRIAGLQSELEQLIASGPRLIITESGRAIQETHAMWERNIQHLQDEIARYSAELDTIPQALSEEEIGLGIWNVFKPFLEGSRKYQEMAVRFERLRVETQFAGLKLELIRLNLWEQWSEVWQDAYNLAMQAAGKPAGGRGGGRGGRGTRQDAQEFMEDRRFDLASRSMTDYQRQMAELNREYDEQTRNIGNNRRMLAELNVIRSQEIALIAEQSKIDLTREFKQFLGIATGFDQIRETASKLIKDLSDSPFGDEEKAAMIGRVIADVDRQLTRLSNDMAAGLLGNLAQLITDETLRNELLRQQEILTFNLRIETSRIEFEILRAERRLAHETLTVLQRSFDWFDANRDRLPGGANWTFGDITVAISGPDIDDSKFQWTGAGWVEKVAEAGGDLADELDRATDLLRQHQEDERDALTRDLSRISEDFTTIRKSLGNTPEVINTFTNAVRRAVDDFMEPIDEFRQSMEIGNLSTLTPEDQLKSVREQFRNLTSNLSLTDRDRLLELARSYHELGRGSTAGEGFRFIEKEIGDAISKFRGLGDAVLAGATIGGSSVAGMASSTSNPVVAAVSASTSAISSGNVLLLQELREANDKLARQEQLLSDIRTQTAEHVTVGHIA